MEHSFKRQRISGPVLQHRHNKSYDDYHGTYSAANTRGRPQDFDHSAEDDEEEFEDDEAEKEDPDAVLHATRAQLENKLKSKFEAIFEKYSKDFTGIGDEIDLWTGEIVVNNGHIAEMRDETDAGDVGKESGMLRAFTEEPKHGLGLQMDDTEDSFDVDETGDGAQDEYHLSGRQMLSAFTQEPEFGRGNRIQKEYEEEEQDNGKGNISVEEDSDEEDNILYQSSGVIPAKSMAASFRPPLTNRHQQIPQSRFQSLQPTPKTNPLSGRLSYPSDPDNRSQFGRQLGPRIIEYVSQQKAVDDSSIEPKWRTPELTAVTRSRRPTLKSILLQPDERSPSPKRTGSIWAPQRKRGRPRTRDIPFMQRPSESETVVRDRTLITRERITTARVPARVPEQKAHRRSEHQRRTASNDDRLFGSVQVQQPAAPSRRADQRIRFTSMDLRRESSYADATLGNTFPTEGHRTREAQSKPDSNMVDENEEQRWDDDDLLTFDDIEQSGDEFIGQNYEPPASEESELSETENGLKHVIHTGPIEIFKPKTSFSCKTSDRATDNGHNRDRPNERRPSPPILAWLVEEPSTYVSPHPKLPVLKRQAEHLSTETHQDPLYSATATARTVNAYQKEPLSSHTIPNSQSSSHSLHTFSPPSSAPTLSKKEKSTLAAATLLGRFRNTAIDLSYDFSDDEDDAAPPRSRATASIPVLQRYRETAVEQPSKVPSPFAQSLLALDALNSERDINQPNQPVSEEKSGTNAEVPHPGPNVKEEEAEIQREPDIAAPPKPTYGLPFSPSRARTAPACVRSPDIASAEAAAEDVHNLPISPRHASTAPLQIRSTEASETNIPQIAFLEPTRTSAAEEPVEAATQDDDELRVIPSSSPSRRNAKRIVKRTTTAKTTTSAIMSPLVQAAPINSSLPSSWGKKMVTYSGSKRKSASNLSSRRVGTSSSLARSNNAANVSSPKPGGQRPVTRSSLQSTTSSRAGSIRSAKLTAKTWTEEDEEADELCMDEEGFTALLSRSIRPSSPSRLKARKSPHTLDSSPLSSAQRLSSSKGAVYRKNTNNSKTSPRGRQSDLGSALGVDALQTPIRRAGKTLGSGNLGRKRRSSPASESSSPVKTPGGTLRRCGHGFKCERDFCFKCS